MTVEEKPPANPQHQGRTVRRILVLIAAILILGAFFYFDLGAYLTLEAINQQQAQMAELLQRSPVLVMSVFFVVYVLLAALIPSAAILTLAGGAFFGFLGGTVLVSFASSISATVAFLASRTLLSETLKHRFPKQLESVNRGVEKEGAFYLFAIRLVPLFPFYVVNPLFGLTGMRVGTFYLISQIAMLPGTMVYVYAGTQLASIRSLSDVADPRLLIAFTLLGVFPLLSKWVLDRIKAQAVYRPFTRPKRFDNNLLVIGAGSAGLISSLIAATVRGKVTLIERDKMGGDCLNTGCVPSKALIRAADVAQTVREGGALGVHAGEPEIDFAQVMAHVKSAITTIEPNDSVERYTELGVNCVQGSATLIDPWTAEVDGERITSRAIVIASGARPFVPPIPGLEDMQPLTSDSVWDLTQVPRRLLVMGAGPIGCELAQSFARLGAQVMLVDMMPRILPREDEDAAAVVEQRLRKEGVVLYMNHRAERFENTDGTCVLHASVSDLSNTSDEEEHVAQLEFDRVLVAVGRKANTEGLGLEALGVKHNRDGTVAVDEYLRTDVPNILACGDVAGPYQFTHTASHQAWYAAVNGLFGFARRFKANYDVIPWVTFTDPELARVGLSESEAAEQGIEVEVARFELAHLDRAIAEAETDGFVKVLTAPGSDKILGATIVGRHAGELLGEFVLAMTHGIGLKKIMATIHVYPTWVEAVKSSASAWRRAHVPERALAFSEKLLAWMR